MASKQEIIEFLAQEFPQALRKCTIEAITDKGAELLYQVDQDDLRPGQTVSGPTLMLVADFVLGGVSKSMLTLNEAIIDVKKG